MGQVTIITPILQRKKLRQSRTKPLNYDFITSWEVLSEEVRSLSLPFSSLTGEE